MELLILIGVALALGALIAVWRILAALLRWLRRLLTPRRPDPTLSLSRRSELEITARVLGGRLPDLLRAELLSLGGYCPPPPPEPTPPPLDPVKPSGLKEVQPAGWGATAVVEPVTEGLEPVTEGLEPVTEGLEPVVEAPAPVVEDAAFESEALTRASVEDEDAALELGDAVGGVLLPVDDAPLRAEAEVIAALEAGVDKRPSALSALFSFENIIFLLSAVLILGGTLYVAATTWGRVPDRWQFVFLNSAIVFYATLMLGAGRLLQRILIPIGPARFITFIAAGVAPICGLIARESFSEAPDVGATAVTISTLFAALASWRLIRLGEPRRLAVYFTLLIAGLSLSGLHPGALLLSALIVAWLSRDEAHLPLIGLLASIPLLSLLPEGHNLVWLGPTLALFSLWLRPLRAYRWSLWAGVALFAFPALLLVEARPLGPFAWTLIIGEVALLRLLIDPDELRKSPLWVASALALILAFTWTTATGLLVPEAGRAAALEWLRGGRQTIPPAWGSLSSVPVVLLGLWATAKLSTKDARRRFSLYTAALISVIAVGLALYDVTRTPVYAAAFIGAHALVWHLWTKRAELGRLGAHALWITGAAALSFALNLPWALTAAAASVILFGIGGPPGRVLNAVAAPLLIWGAIAQGAAPSLCVGLLVAYGLLALLQPIRPRQRQIPILGAPALYWALGLALWSWWPALDPQLALSLALAPFLGWLWRRRGPLSLLNEVTFAAIVLYVTALALYDEAPGYTALASLNALIFFGAVALSGARKERAALLAGGALWLPPFLAQLSWMPSALFALASIYWGLWAWRYGARPKAIERRRLIAWGIAQAALLATAHAAALSLIPLGWSPSLLFGLVGALGLLIMAWGGAAGLWVGLIGAWLILAQLFATADASTPQLWPIGLLNLGFAALLAWQPRRLWGAVAVSASALYLLGLLTSDLMGYAPLASLNALLLYAAARHARGLKKRLTLTAGVALWLPPFFAAPRLVALLLFLLNAVAWAYVAWRLGRRASAKPAHKALAWGIAQSALLVAATATALALQAWTPLDPELLFGLVGALALAVLALGGLSGRWVGFLGAALFIGAFLEDAHYEAPRLIPIVGLSLGLGALLLWQPRGAKARLLVWLALPAALLGWGYGLVEGLRIDENFYGPVTVAGLLLALIAWLQRGGPRSIWLEIRWGLLAVSVLTLLTPLDWGRPVWVFALAGGLGFLAFVFAMERDGHPRSDLSWSGLALALPFAAALLGPLLTWPGAATALLCGLALLPISKWRGGPLQAALGLLLVFLGAEWLLAAIATLFSTGRGAAHLLPAVALVALLWGVFARQSRRFSAVDAPWMSRAERSSLLVAGLAVGGFGLTVLDPSGADVPLMVLALLALAALSVRVAFRLKITWALYLAEASTLALYAWLRARTTLLDGLADYDGVFLVAMAFILTASARWLRAKQRGFGPQQLDLTASLLPLLLPTVMEWDHSLSALGPLAATFLYAWIGRNQRKVSYVWIAVLLLNVALIPVLVARQITAPSAWLMPLGFTLLFMVQRYRHEMPQAAPRLRSLAALLLLGGGAWETLATEGVWPALLLGAVAVAGVMLGLIWRARAYLFLGFGFLLLDMAVNLTRWGMGDRLIGGLLALAAGVGLFILASVVVARKAQLLARYRDIQSWEW
ncbi:hypothetical protein KJ940_06260 [Myxococcota bacterium]|nr:hypothetical protein [Myxococcota bacterium]